MHPDLGLPPSAACPTPTPPQPRCLPAFPLTLLLFPCTTSKPTPGIRMHHASSTTTPPRLFLPYSANHAQVSLCPSMSLKPSSSPVHCAGSPRLKASTPLRKPASDTYLSITLAARPWPLQFSAPTATPSLRCGHTCSHLH